MNTLCGYRALNKEVTLDFWEFAAPTSPNPKNRTLPAGIPKQRCPQIQFWGFSLEFRGTFGSSFIPFPTDTIPVDPFGNCWAGFGVWSLGFGVWG